MYTSVDFKLKDINFKELRFRYYNDGSSVFLSKGISDAALIFVGGNQRVSVYGTALKNEDNSYYNFDIDKWYTFTQKFDTNTGIVVATFTDGEKSFTVTKDISATSVGTGVFRSHTYITSLASTATQSDILFDNFTFAYRDDINHFAHHEYDATDISGGSNHSVTVPLKDTSFMYKSTVTTSDASICKISAVTADGNISLANFGNIAGNYGISIIINPALNSASVSITDPKGNTNNSNVSLGESKVDVNAISFTNESTENILTVGAATLESMYDFTLDREKSTTGPDAEVEDDSVIKAVFTNKINKSSFTETTVKMPYNTDTDYTITFPDDYTAQINFVKVMGTHYHILFDGVSDIFGNTLTDYIEFDTVVPDLYMTDIQFIRDDSMLTLTSPGEITASFEAQANNGNSYNMMFALALYNGTELYKVTSESFIVGSTKSTYSLRLNVPDDENYYIAKAFLWNDDTLEPYIEEKTLKATTNLPVVILRFDDLKSQKINDFDEVTQWLDYYDLKACYGFMGYQILNNVSSTIRDEFDSKIIAMKNNPRIELWHHGYADQNMYEGKTVEEQRADFSNCIDGAYEKYGITFSAFCPPSSKLDETTLNLMNNEFTNFKVLMTDKPLEDMGYENKYNFTVLSNLVRIEASDRILPIETLKSNWEKAVDAGHEYVIMYSHPGYSWNKLTTNSETEYGKDSLTQFIEYLKSEGVVFMNPTEYVEYVHAIK